MRCGVVRKKAALTGLISALLLPLIAPRPTLAARPARQARARQARPDSRPKRERTPLVAVSLRVVGLRGRAFRTVSLRGKASCGHMSGGPTRPRVYQERKTVKTALLKKLRRLARRLEPRARALVFAQPKLGPSYSVVELVFRSRRAAVYLLGTGMTHPDKHVAALATLLADLRCGGW